MRQVLSLALSSLLAASCGERGDARRRRAPERRRHHEHPRRRRAAGRRRPRRRRGRSCRSAPTPTTSLRRRVRPRRWPTPTCSSSTAPASRRAWPTSSTAGRADVHVRRPRRVCSATTRTCGPTRRAWPPPSRRSARDSPSSTASTPTRCRRRRTTTSPSCEALDAEMEATLAAVPPERRVLVTNHEVFAYFADRFDFEVLGAVIPSLTTGAQASAADLDELAATDPRRPACRRSSPRRPARPSSPTPWPTRSATSRSSSCSPRASASEGSGAETYVDMMRTNADLVAGALR